MSYDAVYLGRFQEACEQVLNKFGLLPLMLFINISQSKGSSVRGADRKNEKRVFSWAFLLCYQCVDEVLQFVTEFTEHVEGVGHVCRSAFFLSHTVLKFKFLSITK